jgi:hypothetical protein
VPTTRNRPGVSMLVSEVFTLNSNIINQATANFSYVSQHIPPYGVNYLRSTYGFQYQKLFPTAGEYPTGIPSVSITNYAPFTGPYFALNSPTTDIQASDTVSIVRGNHLIKFGGVYIRDRIDQNGRPNYNGSAVFNISNNPNTTGNALADALLGNFQSYTEARADPISASRSPKRLRRTVGRPHASSRSSSVFAGKASFRSTRKATTTATSTPRITTPPTPSPSPRQARWFQALGIRTTASFAPPPPFPLTRSAGYLTSTPRPIPRSRPLLLVDSIRCTVPSARA